MKHHQSRSRENSETTALLCDELIRETSTLSREEKCEKQAQRTREQQQQQSTEKLEKFIENSTEIKSNEGRKMDDRLAYFSSCRPHDSVPLHGWKRTTSKG